MKSVKSYFSLIVVIVVGTVVVIIIITYLVRLHSVLTGAFHILLYTTCCDKGIISISQLRKLKFREINQCPVTQRLGGKLRISDSDPVPCVSRGFPGCWCSRHRCSSATIFCHCWPRQGACSQAGTLRDTSQNVYHRMCHGCHPIRRVPAVTDGLTVPVHTRLSILPLGYGPPTALYFFLWGRLLSSDAHRVLFCFVFSSKD